MLRRRSVLAGLASMTTVAAAVPLTKLVADPGDTRVRYDARSKEGKAMLAIYARGVAALKAANADKPLSWTFQWYTHFVTGNSTKGKELERVFGPKPSEAKMLAELMWSTCQAHSGGMPEFNFLPWHRAYVFYFERIVRSLTTDEFTLPYWNYTTDAAIPEEFLKPTDPVLGVLYVAKRNANTNAGQPIAGKNLINLDPLKQISYLPGSDGVPPGFNANLDRTLHGYVHVYTGNGENMGTVSYAAYDPIFWLHHCNIDRLWAAWNANGGTNPTTTDWKEQRHAFVTVNSRPVYVTNAEMTSIEPLGYKYDNLPARPELVSARTAETQPRATMAAAAAPPALASLDHAITLGAGPTRVQLSPSRSIAAQSRESLGAGNRRTYLVVGDVHTNVQPGVAYSIYTTGSTRTFLGAIQFFDAKPEGAKSSTQFVFDVTDKLDVSNSQTPLSYEIVPEGSPDETAKPLVGSITLLRK